MHSGYDEHESYGSEAFAEQQVGTHPALGPRRLLVQREVVLLLEGQLQTANRRILPLALQLQVDPRLPTPPPLPQQSAQLRPHLVHVPQPGRPLQRVPSNIELPLPEIAQILPHLAQPFGRHLMRILADLLDFLEQVEVEAVGLLTRVFEMFAHLQDLPKQRVLLPLHVLVQRMEIFLEVQLLFFKFATVSPQVLQTLRLRALHRRERIVHLPLQVQRGEGFGFEIGQLADLEALAGDEHPAAVAEVHGVVGVLEDGVEGGLGGVVEASMGEGLRVVRTDILLLVGFEVALRLLVGEPFAHRVLGSGVAEDRPVEVADRRKGRVDGTDCRHLLHSDQRIQQQTTRLNPPALPDLYFIFNGEIRARRRPPRPRPPPRVRPLHPRGTRHDRNAPQQLQIRRPPPPSPPPPYPPLPQTRRPHHRHRTLRTQKNGSHEPRYPHREGETPPTARSPRTPHQPHPLRPTGSHHRLRLHAVAQLRTQVRAEREGNGARGGTGGCELRLPGGGQSRAGSAVDFPEEQTGEEVQGSVRTGVPAGRAQPHLPLPRVPLSLIQRNHIQQDNTNRQDNQFASQPDRCCLKDSCDGYGCNGCGGVWVWWVWVWVADNN